MLPAAVTAQEQSPHGADEALYAEVFAEATRFGEVTGEPPAAPAFKEDERLGYVFFTREVVASTGYAGKPLDVVVGLDETGRITGARIVEQHEPILVIGVEERDLERFVEQYRGRDVRAPADVTRRASDDPNAIDAVAGATISSRVINDAILRAARAVARSRGILGETARLDRDSFEPADWQKLVAEGWLSRLHLAVGDVQDALAERGARLYPEAMPERDPKSTFVELVFGLASPAQAGRNLLGERLYNRVMAELGVGDDLLFVAGRGTWSFKGTAYRQTGTFERLQLVQDAKTITFREDDHRRVDELAIEGAPDFRELALFRLPEASGFDATRPFRLELLVSRERDDGTTASVSFDESWTPPEDFVVRPPPAPEETAAPLWHEAWRDRTTDIAIVATALAILTGILVFQDAIARRRRLHLAIRLGFLVFTLFWLGWYAAAQLSVLNVLTFTDALRTGFEWDTFLLEPLMFILWSYVAVALLFWGRGVFCGWLCPFGALQELTNRAARRLKVPQYRVPFAVHERLWPVKYVVFLGLFALSLGPMALAYQLAEVEPFKTAIILRFDRALWPFVLYVLVLLGVGLFVERAFCRYLCPLGAALAIPAKLRLFEWLKRHRQCGAPCQICAVDCPVQAIHPEGRINPNECIYCLTCQVNYYDAYVCPPMIERRQRREKRAAMRARGGAKKGAEEHGQAAGGTS